jgi:hypothetical protein
MNILKLIILKLNMVLKVTLVSSQSVGCNNKLQDTNLRENTHICFVRLEKLI